MSPVGLGLGQVLQCLSFTTHTVVAKGSRDIKAVLAEVEVHRGFVRFKNSEVELVAACSQTQLRGNKIKK